jgi:CxxC motif-containing protein (DUF1111 family)
MKEKGLLVALVLALTFIGNATGLMAQHDPGPIDKGPRKDAAAAGGFYPTLNAAEQAIFSNGLDSFTEINDSVPRVNGSGGLGPTFNSNSCVSCHSQPAPLGSSPSPSSPQVPQQNPQIAAGQSMGAVNVIPSFITTDGPVREARFISYPKGRPDGGVHDLFTIAGRSDAKGCSLAQPDFAAQLAAGNVSFRIPTPLFGLGLVESTTDNVLRDNLKSTAKARRELGIEGRFNTSGNTGNITKFGWKAQNPSLMVFAGEAYNVEMGITNDSFPDERVYYPGCMYNTTPEDMHPGSDIEAFTDAMRLSAPPTPLDITKNISATNGQTLFESVGCNLCHSESLTTGQSGFTGMSGVTYNPFSDFALHDMGVGLRDGISQGLAGPREFRTAPLWGIGQRLFFLHDGRTSDLLQAIQAHASRGSEANQVINNFNRLSNLEVQHILDFLRSL